MQTHAQTDQNKDKNRSFGRLKKKKSSMNQVTGFRNKKALILMRIYNP